MENKYKWTRFWCPHDKNYVLTEKGFLLDPETPYAKYYDSFAVKFDEIPDSECIVFLGEPGIGKSTTITEIYNGIKLENATKVVRIDLRSYNTADGLVFDLNGNLEIQEWINSDYYLTLFFDSLDECILNVRTVAALLVDRIIKSWPYQRLKLRFVCRTVDWPDLLDNELRSLYGMDVIPKYELLPLREKDIEEASNIEGVDFNNFLESVLSTDVTAFAIKPITLKFLLNYYKKGRRLPDSKSIIYWEGCLQLCEEKNKSRIASRRTGKLNPVERLIIASRIAAIVILSKKSSILVKDDEEEVSSADVRVRDLSGFTEVYKDIVITVSDDAVKETLGTALFSSRGESQVGFAHQAYAEFLAAFYLNTSKIPQKKIAELIFHSEGKIIPQLQEVAVWLSTFSTFFLEKIMSIQPDLILRIDKAAIREESKSLLVDHLLAAYENKELVNVYEILRYLDHVNYPGLANQLNPVIKNRTRDDGVRQLAIMIVRKCKRVELIELLISIALDDTERYLVRKYSALTVVDAGSEADKARLLPLAMGKTGNDSEDELKGMGLKAVWPEHISIDTLIKVITPMKNQDLIGSYYSFLDSDFIAGLQLKDLPKVLNWIITGMPALGSEIVTDNLIVSVMLMGWENIENPEIGSIFAKLVIKRFKNYEESRSFSKDRSYLEPILKT